MSESLPAPTLASFLRESCACELERALRLLGDATGERDAAVHEGRKSLRRVRAWLRLCSPTQRAELAPIDSALRAVRRTLGPLRDARTRIEALDRLRKRRDLGELRPWLKDARKLLTEALAARWRRRPRHGRAYARMLTSLTALARNVADWPLENFSLKHAERSLQRSFARARVARRECAGRTGAVVRHEWRGRVRILVLQCQFLEAFGVVQGFGELKDLGQALGEEHDLAVVSRELGRLGLPMEARSGLRAYLSRHRLSLVERNDRSARQSLRRSKAPKLRRARPPKIKPASAFAPIENAEQ